MRGQDTDPSPPAARRNVVEAMPSGPTRARYRGGRTPQPRGAKPPGVQQAARPATCCHGRAERGSGRWAALPNDVSAPSVPSCQTCAPCCVHDRHQAPPVPSGLMDQSTRDPYARGRESRPLRVGTCPPGRGCVPPRPSCSGGTPRLVSTSDRVDRVRRTGRRPSVRSVLLLAHRLRPTAPAAPLGRHREGGARCSRSRRRRRRWTVTVGGTTHVLTTDRGGYVHAEIARPSSPAWHDAMVAVRGRAARRDASPRGRRTGDPRSGERHRRHDPRHLGFPRPLLAAWNTFFLREHARRPVPGMSDLLRRLAGEHGFMVYLSTGAWNFAPHLERFMAEHGLPARAAVPHRLGTHRGRLVPQWGCAQARRRSSGSSVSTRTREWVLVGDDGRARSRGLFRVRRRASRRSHGRGDPPADPERNRCLPWAQRVCRRNSALRSIQPLLPALGDGGGWLHAAVGARERHV